MCEHSVWYYNLAVDVFLDMYNLAELRKRLDSDKINLEIFQEKRRNLVKSGATKEKLKEFEKSHQILDNVHNHVNQL